MRAKIIGDSQDNFDCPDGYGYMPWFYLHYEAETINHYDIVLGNIDCFQEALRNHIFLADLKLQDGSEHEGIVFTFYKENRMQGLVCLCSDLEGIRNVLFEYKSEWKINFDTCIEDGQKKHLALKYPEILVLIKEYNTLNN